MTISSSSRTAGPFVGNGVLAALPFTFKVFQASDMLIVRTNAGGTTTTLALGSGYTVSLNADQNAAPGGTVTILSPAANFPTGSTAYLSSSIAVTQPLALANGGPYLAKSIEDALDRLTILTQQSSLFASQQALRAPFPEQLNELPPVDSRKGMQLLFHPTTGQPLLGAPISGSAADVLVTLAGSGGAALVGYLGAGAGAAARPVNARLNAEPFSGNFPTLAAASASGVSHLTIEAGAYVAGANISFPMPVRIMPGAVITVNTGVTLAFNGGFEAGVHQTFAIVGTGAVTFDNSKTRSGYAEWWGAVTSHGTGTTLAVATATTAAINRAVIALQKVELMPSSDYITDSKVLIALQNRELVGHSSQTFGGDVDGSTRIRCNNATSSIVQLGPDAQPATSNDCPKGIVLRDVHCDRWVAPNIASACVGVRVQWCLRATLERVKSQDSIYGFLFSSTIGCRALYCDATRTLAGTGGGSDLWYGFYAFGLGTFADRFNFPGGNASLFWFNCVSSCNNGPLQASGSTGFYIDGAFTDLFLYEPESGNCTTGISVRGDNNNVQSGASPNPNYSNLDLTIDNPILDSCTLFGLYVKNVNKFGGVMVKNPYVALATSGSVGTAAIFIEDCPGSTTIIGGQVFQRQNTFAQGVVISASSGVVIRDTQLIDCTSNPVNVNASSNCVVEPVIKNHVITANCAVQVNGASLVNKIAPVAFGKASGFSLGIQVVGTSDARNEYNLTGIDSSAVTGGSGNKLVRNSVQITAANTLTGTNITSGVMT